MSKDEKNSGTNIDRRRFLKGMASTSAAVAISAARPAATTRSDEEEKNVTTSWRDKPDPIDEKLISNDGTYDVVVMGGWFGISPGLCATTGLDTDADGHVLNSELKPIKGLYAADNNAGGRFMIVYQSPLAGINIGMAITDGYLLGERLAAL